MTRVLCVWHCNRSSLLSDLGEGALDQSHLFAHYRRVNAAVPCLAHPRYAWTASHARLTHRPGKPTRSSWSLGSILWFCWMAWQAFGKSIVNDIVSTSSLNMRMDYCTSNTFSVHPCDYSHQKKDILPPRPWWPSCPGRPLPVSPLGPFCPLTPTIKHKANLYANDLI